MTDLNLTPDERHIVESMARVRGIGSHLGDYGSVLVPMLVFAGYGIIQHDFPSVVVALIGLLIFEGWQIARQVSLARTWAALCKKVAEHERASDKFRGGTN